MSLEEANSEEQFLEIRKTEYGGRGYFAKREIPKGTEILICSESYGYVIFKPFKKEVCAYCFAYNGGKACKFKLALQVQRKNGGAYGGVYFCGEDCRDAWTRELDFDGEFGRTLEIIEQAVARGKEKRDGKNVSIDSIVQLAKIDEEDNTKTIEKDAVDKVWETVDAQIDGISLPTLDDTEYDSARLLAMTLVQAYRESLDGNQSNKHFEELQSNELAHLQQYPFLLRSHTKTYVFLRRTLPAHLAELCTSQVVRSTLGKEAGNAFGIWEQPMMSESECFGSMIHPAASYFNHECEPTVKKERKDNKMVFTTVRDIEKGQQLFISYGMMEELDYNERLKILQNQWHFTCQCRRCINDAANTLATPEPERERNV